MPTTCGFPNCKFRSRYRGSDDSRHFYRVPKKPAVLRERWLLAIGRTEETIVNQVRAKNGFVIPVLKNYCFKFNCSSPTFSGRDLKPAVNEG